MAAGTYGVSRFFFKKSVNLSETINSGKLDAYIVQPKNVLLATITSDIEVSAIGDMLFAIIVYFIYGFNITTFILYLFFCITGGIMLTAISVILNSLSFWFNNADMVSDVGNSLIVNFATYPDGIFKGITKWLLFTLIPVGVINYIPIKALMILAYVIFYRGLKKYSSSNLISARI